MARHLIPISYDQLNGWAKDDHAAAMQAFLKSARQMVEKPYKTRALNLSSSKLVAISRLAIAQEPFSRDLAQIFFETHFNPCQINDGLEKTNGYDGFVTAYYEPEIAASRMKTGGYTAPLYSRPDDLVDVPAGYCEHGWNSYFRFARKMPGAGENSGGYQEYPDRQAIENGYLQGKGLEIAFVKDKVEALFIHIQGSARLRLGGGGFIRVGYAAKSGHPYTAIGKVLLERGALDRKDCGMQAIRDWLRQNPDQIDPVINQNRSFIFFKENKVDKTSNNMSDGPIGAARVALSSGRSLAVDKNLHTFGIPFWIDCKDRLPGQKEDFQRLMIAQDTGSAIVGACRGDLFLGSGDRAGTIAGDVRHAARFVVLAPKGDC